MKARLFFCLLIAQFVSLSAQTLTITSFELPNGLKVILAPSSGTQAASVCVYHMRGARQEPADRRGISSL
jgi:predicted Zn-dependent peptidase